ncbi:SMP-30/gluconolactonase/LRE family protein [Sphingomonas sp. CL5.1]|uniref:SMP-30/gluconolactonase/LRE family protein n=1 Tax=Sphingomonas sp. CL5.1 TaxID=2653203 RepID=UPI001582E8CD|nr:SMP-30/gluconolactonase/LRE family protein [Sphingomonas sp. CL5.1]QKS00060.1 SMP-30/gluconolactonase/LRE family protein [Sphingomonas sp. CL5.1]
MDRRNLLASAVSFTVFASAFRSGGKANVRPSLSGLSVIVEGLDHPEGIAVRQGGAIIFSDAHAAVSIRKLEGEVVRYGTAVAPCGVAVDRNGNAIVANMGLLSGKPGILQRVDLSTGKIDVLASSVEGRPLVASNNPIVASDGTIYCSHSTWDDVALIGKVRADGFVYAVLPSGEVRIVARDIRGANGTCLNKDETYLYVCSTAEGRIFRYRRRGDGSLGQKESYGPKLGRTIDDQSIEAIRQLNNDDRAQLGYCDGIIFDRTGNLWITLPFANKIAVLMPDMKLLIAYHDPDGSLVNVPTNMAWDHANPNVMYLVSRGSNTIVRGLVQGV